ncbi:MAG: OmpA family protein [Pseudomonadota bacterium]
MSKKIIAVGLALALAGCTTNPYTGERQVSKTVIGAGAGAAVGALGGLIVGQNSSANKRTAVLVGAGIGALAGGAVGVYMDNQEAKLRQQLQGTGVSVTRNGDRIILNMPSNVTFDTDQSAIKPQFFSVLNSVGLVLKEFDKTLINVFGHTDSDGDLAYNQQLSESRALSVAQYLISQGTDQRRYYVVGYGETRPIASNATPNGKAENRRVEIELSPLQG